MPIKIEPNTPLIAHRVRSGTNSNGPWELIGIRDTGKGKKTATIWPNNVPSGVVEGGQFVVENITSLSYGSMKSGEKWYDDVSVHCTVKPLADYGNMPASPHGFDVLADDDGDLPF